MEIQHRISLNSRKDEELFHLINKIGIKYVSKEIPGGKSHIVYFDITESDPNWPKVSYLVQNYKVVDIYDTFFTEREVLDAEWSRLISTYTEGYPQPFNTWVTNPINYKNICRVCGTFQQESSFQIKKEPILKGNDFMTLNWAVSTFFCTPKVVKVFNDYKITGYEPWKVIISSTGLPSQKLLQLFVADATSPGLLGENELTPVKCPQCDITKYFHHQHGIMKYRRNSFNPEHDIVRSFEWFGAGRDAYQEVFVSNRVIRIILDKGWRGIRFKIVELL